MTLVCVPITVDDLAPALEDAERARLAGADMVEWRVDSCFHGEGDDEGIALCLRLCEHAPLPCIVTCRDRGEGGAYDGDDAAKIALYERLGTSAHPPAYLDLELSLWRRSANLRQKALLGVQHPGQMRPSVTTRLILSHHDFDGRPRDLSRILNEMRAVEAARVLKIAWRARSLRDNLEAFDLLTERDRPTIALCMGEFGLMSRVLAPKFGGFLTFASLHAEGATAPGQPTVEELLGTYRFRSVHKSTGVYGVIGWPVGHSLSPLVHNAGFEAAGHDGVYLPLPVAEGWEPLKATLHALADARALQFRGASVTIPHKEGLMRFCAETPGWSPDEDTMRIGAANTLARDEAGWAASNTDAPAIVACLHDALGPIRGRRVLVLSAGGAARAAAAGLAGAGAQVRIAARTVERAEAIRNDLAEHAALEGGAIEVCAWEERAGAACDAVINCTPLGMRGGPGPELSPLSDAQLDALGECVVFDTVYNPVETPLLRAAASRGMRTIDGVSMFVRQAAGQFELWAGQRVPRELFERVVREGL
jgi:3-dehydroquinate dehydratase/shikimate dehydrogenase